MYLRRGKYTFTDTSTGDRYGPSEHLEEILSQASLTWVNEATMSISSEILTAEEIVTRLDVELPVGRTIGINDDEWVCVAPGRLEREEPTEQPKARGKGRKAK